MILNTSWRQRAFDSIAQEALTNSKRPSTFVNGVYPTHCKGGRGAKLLADGREFIDYYGALGSNLFGYGNLEITQAITDALKDGITHSMPTYYEVELAEALKGIFRFTDLWKFGKNGSDVCAAALKIARAYSNRELVLSSDYHGIADDFVSLTPPALGVPSREWIKPLNDNLHRICEAAAVIIEPVVLDMSEKRREYLNYLRYECSRTGTLLIFDEIITGFRVPKFSVATMWGIEPDLILTGKAMGGGMPISAIGGKKDVMACGEYFYSGTFFGESLSIRAALKAIEMLKTSKYSLDDLMTYGSDFMKRFNELSVDVQIDGYGTRGAFKGDALVKAQLWQEAVRAGIYFGPSWFFNFSLHEHTDLVINTCRDIFTRIKIGDVRLNGQLPRATFAEKARAN